MSVARAWTFVATSCRRTMRGCEGFAAPSALTATALAPPMSLWGAAAPCAAAHCDVPPLSRRAPVPGADIPSRRVRAPGRLRGACEPGVQHAPCAQEGDCYVARRPAVPVVAKTA